LKPSNTELEASIKVGAQRIGISMSQSIPSMQVVIGMEIFQARLRRDLAPHSCARLQELLPYRGTIIHARWSGEACWSSLAAVWPFGSILPPEHATEHPEPGQVLLFAGALSEPELLIAYGPSRFASEAGPLAGNPVVTIEDRIGRLAELGRAILWHGAMEFRIDLLAQ
jgi:Protein of unknown function (DUF3830)